MKSLRTRVEALLLSSVMLLNAPVAWQRAYAANTADDVTIKLSYLNSDEGDPQTASIIRGKSVDMRVEAPDGYTQVKDSDFNNSETTPFTVKAPGNDTNLYNQSIVIKDNNNGTKAVTTSPTIPMPSTGLATFAITGNFYAIMAKGDAYESAADLGNSLTTIEAKEKNAVMQYSEATIICTKEEINGGVPEFRYKPGTDKKGIFSSFDTISVVQGETTQDSTDSGKPAEKVLTLQFSKGNNTKVFTLYPRQTHPNYRKDPATGDWITDESGQKKEFGRNNYIARDTEFKLVFRLPASNDLFLNVLSPERAVINVAEEIERNDGEKNQSYIRLGKDDQGVSDTLNFITTDFELNSRVWQYGTDFNIEWVWEPKADSTGVDHSGVVVISNSGDWRKVKVTPEKNDVEGTLQATVYYNKGKEPSQSDIPTIGASMNLSGTDGLKQVAFKTHTIPIRIRGTGEPAEVKQFNQTIGMSSVEVFQGDKQKLPSAKDMDVYDGNVVGYDQPVFPNKYVLHMSMGRLNAASQYATVEVVDGDADVISVRTMANNLDTNIEEYTFGEQIENPKKTNTETAGDVYLEMTAKKEGRVKLQITFFVIGKGDKVVPASVQPKPITINVYDTSPSDDASLQSLVLKDNKKKIIEYEFSPGTLQYDISIPYSVDKITVTPTRNDPQANKWIERTITYIDETGGKVTIGPEKQESGRISEQIDLTPNVPVTIKLVVTAQNPNVHTTYILNVMRLPPSDDSSLKSLQLLDKDGEDKMEGFDPEVFEYSISVPFKADMLQVFAEANHPGVKKIEYSPELKKNGLFGDKNWLELTKPGVSGTTDLTITVTPENNVPYDISKYTVKITRLPPSKIATLSELKVTDNTEERKELPYTPAFHKEMEPNDYYNLEIPYATSKIRISAKPDDENATIAIQHDGKTLVEISGTTPSKALNIPAMKNENDFYELTVLVTAEDSVTTVAYPIHVMRAMPSTDASLKDLQIADQDDAVITDFEFNPEIYDYTLTVPYETEKVSLTPTPNNENVESIKVNGRKVKPGEKSSYIKLDYPKVTTIEVEITAEDGKTTQKYTIKITRSAPSSDARLKALTASNTKDWTPLFIASTLDYSATLIQGSPGTNVTATANEPHATITINGKKVESGTASDLIETLEIKETIEIVVTAQDGKTTMTYTIELTNENLIEKSSNADLDDLKVKPGIMTPKFESSIMDYDVAVTEEVSSIEIIPTPADEMAKVQVFAGSREIGDENGNYLSAIVDGENEFSVTVTAPDESKSKTYTILVYRNEVDKMGVLKPITADQIDFKNSDNIITVDITKYTRVAADVFNELKKYPEKTIVFQGNDYSLQFNAKDIQNVVPFTEIFDFGMKFTSPYRDDIFDILDRYPRNDRARLVFIHFNYHGSLPAPALFTISLGHKYRDDTLYWHYYNDERRRIDYYGMVDTNSQGTFAVTLEHMSTYIVSDIRLSGSENKAPADEALSDQAAVNKVNPDTGKREVLQ